jgi:hypothetical protein
MAGESAREEARRAREKAERLTRRAELFEKGAEGETATAAVLATLPAGWAAIHDARWPSRRFANIDHILVGPGGIYVIDSKNWSGRITVDGGHLRQNGRSREKEVAGCADAGLAVAELAGPHADRVFPVMCFLTDEPLSGWCRDVMVCSTATLSQMLLTRPSVLDSGASTDAWFRLDAQLRAATEPVRVGSRQGSSARRMTHSSTGSGRASARSRRAAARRKKALRQFVLSLVLLAGFVAYGSQISTAVGGMLAEQLTKDLAPPPACDENSAEGPKAAAGRDQQAGQAGETGSGKSQKKPAGKAPPGDAASTETTGASPDC